MNMCPFAWPPEKKLEGAHHMASSSHQSYNSSSSPATSFSSSSTIHKLDLIVREIIGGGIFDGHRHDEIITETTSSQDEQLNKPPQQGHLQPNKKTRSHSPTRKSPPGLSTLDNILFHGHSSPPSSNSRRDKDCMDLVWEKVMWESASILSNCRPSPSFVANRQDRNRHEEDIKSVSKAPLKSEEGLQAQGGKVGKEKNNLTQAIFEGNVANATPGDLADGGTGAGTAQHLACLLDSPFALALLIVLGVNVEARHTAFRRLAIHEAACADSPRCLSLLMEVGTRFSMELLRESLAATASGGSAVPTATAAAAASTAGGDGLNSSSAESVASSPSVAAASATGFGSAGSGSELFSSETEDGNISTAVGRKPGKTNKLPNLFRWQKGKTPGVGGAASASKKSSSSECCEKAAEFTPFPETLRIIWEAAKLLRTGDMNEMSAAHYILDRVKVSNRAMLTLALQCPHLPPSMKHSDEDMATAPPLSSSPFASIPGLSVVNQLFQSNHRDMQTHFIKRNVDGHGNTPLHWAAFKNSIRAVDVLLSYNVDVNSRAQPSGWTPLHDAAYSDAAEAVSRLIVAGALVDARSHSGATPLCFAAQEDAPNATRMLLKAGADPSMRCLGNSPGIHIRANNADNNQFHSRFSGYTPLHYCAHYNAAKAARVLLYESNRHHLLEIPDLNEKLPIHVAVARGSSLVLRELLHGGARVETASYHPPPSPRARAPFAALAEALTGGETPPVAILGNNSASEEADTNNASPGSTPVSSPILRALIPRLPINSSKPWNCLSQKSIDACKHLIEEVEMNWTPERHSLFSPADRVAVVEVLRVGKRLEQVGRGIFLDLWPHVLSYCGRGWFEPEPLEGEELDGKVSASPRREHDKEEEIEMQSSEEDVEEEEECTQFKLEGANDVTIL